MNIKARKGLPVLLFAGLLFFPLQKNNMTTNEGIVTVAAENPLLQPWRGNYGGVPAFDKVKPEHFYPAFEKIRQQRLEIINTMTSNPSAPDFDNTIAPLERSERLMNSFYAYYSTCSSNLSTPEFQAVETKISPLLSALTDEIVQNEKLFKRLEAVYQSDELKKLSSEQQRLVWYHYTDFVRSGAKLDAASKARLKEINTALANLFTRFRQNVLADEEQAMIVVDSETELEGLPQVLKDAAKAAAAERQLNDKWVISNTRSSIDPLLAYAHNRALREKAWKMFISRGDNPNKNNTNELIPQILQLRMERAKLLGFPTHAHWRLQNTMAGTPENAMKLMMDVWKPAIGRVAEEVADMQGIADKENANITIEPWDYHFYMEKVRKDRYSFDQDELKPYLQLDKLREGMFFVAEQLFNLKFVPVKDVPVYHPDVQVWKVQDKNTRSTVGLWYFDPFTRKGKRSGAWMNSPRDQERMDKVVIPIVTNNANFVKGKPGEPVLISWDDATTLFHEFGHALHGLNSNVTYPSLSGTNVFRDYVEFPSQLLEHWLSAPEVRARYLVHYKTGKAIPDELVRKLEQTTTFKQGYSTTEYLASALVDMKLHTSTATNIDPVTFEKEILNELGMPGQIVMRHRMPHFLHIFSGDSYSAGYYSYLWSDVLTADAWQAFVEAGNACDQEVAARLKQHVFAVGNTEDPAAAYRKFRGRDPKVEALMKKRGFN